MLKIKTDIRTHGHLLSRKPRSDSNYILPSSYFAQVNCILSWRESIGHLRITVESLLKRVLVIRLSYEHEFDLHENSHVGRIDSHMNDFTRRFVLTQRQKCN